LEIAFFCTHLDYRDETVRLQQVERIEQVTAAVEAPVVILTGDFNAEPGSAPVRRILESWRDTGGDTLKGGQPAEAENLLTYPAAAPIKRIDYVFYRSSPRLRVVERRVIDEQVASDHRPVLVEFEVAGPE
jgi:endonuclease/exonuclease/phosphatase family metal-dependent hydrolase